jgi:hypothetical protein
LEGRYEVRKEGNIEWYVDGAHTVEAAARWFAEKLSGVPKGGAMLSKLETDPHSCGPYILNCSKQLEQDKSLASNAAFCVNTPYRQDLQSTTDIAELTVGKATAGAWSEH